MDEINRALRREAHLTRLASYRPNGPSWRSPLMDNVSAMKVGADADSSIIQAFMNGIPKRRTNLPS